MLSNQKERLTFDQIPQLVSDLKDQISDLAQQVAALTAASTGEPQDHWMNLAEFCAYHPDHPAKPTVYEWVSLKKVPVHKDGKKLRFLKSEIDQWLGNGRIKTQAELDQEAYEYLRTSKKTRR